MIYTLRLLHIFLGVFWAGTVLFFGFFLEPALNAVGPAAGQVVRELNVRRYAQFMPLAALLTILSGVELLRRLTGGGPSAWMQTRAGTTFMVGGTAALITLIMGVTITLPTVKRMGALAIEMTSAPESEQGRIGGELAAVRAKLRMLTKTGTVLVCITVIAMAIGRYM